MGLVGACTMGFSRECQPLYANALAVFVLSLQTRRFDNSIRVTLLIADSAIECDRPSRRDGRGLQSQFLSSAVAAMGRDDKEGFGERFEAFFWDENPAHNILRDVWRKHHHQQIVSICEGVYADH